MQLKHRGKTVEVTLKKAEKRYVHEVGELLASLALLPCAQQERAAAILGPFAEIAAELAAEEAEEE